MLTAEQVLRVLQRADLLSGWQLLPPSDEQARQKARAWAEVLDNRLTYAEAIDIVDKHCRTQHRPLAVVDLNEPVERRHATGAPSSTGALQRMREQQRGAVPCPADVDLHRFRGVTPRYRTRVAVQQPGTAAERIQPDDQPDDPPSNGHAHALDGDAGFNDQVSELAYPPPAASYPNARTMGA